MRYTLFDTPLCPVLLAGNDGVLEYIGLQTGIRSCSALHSWKRSDEQFAEARNQLLAYLNGGLREFSLPLKMNGTPFQKKVWNALLSIPYGEVVSYKDIADTLGVKNGARAVGMANAKNPLPLVVPCHRVIGADGKLTGYAYGLELKEKLLALEGVTLNG